MRGLFARMRSGVTELVRRIFAPKTREAGAPAEIVREIANQAMGDAVEITLLIGLLQEQNTGGVNKRLEQADASQAGIVLRNALIARLVVLVARAYAKPRQGDRHVRVAADLLKDKTTREIFQTGADGPGNLAAFETHWKKCRRDHRLRPITHFRDKYTAHLGEPKDIPPASYRDLFAFAAETAKAMEFLARVARVAVVPIVADLELTASPKKFWAPWKQPG
jgi:hypothetical protein